MYKETNITAYEVVYAKCASITLIMFLYLLYKGIYILDLDQSLRI